MSSSSLSSTLALVSSASPLARPSRAKRRILEDVQENQACIIALPQTFRKLVNLPTENTHGAMLRSGRRLGDPHVLEATIMQIVSLSDFVLATPDRCVSPGRSAERNVKRFKMASDAASSTSSCTTSQAHGSPGTPVSQASTVAVWTPQRVNRQNIPLWRRVVPPVPDWFASVYESEDYDSETVAELAGLLTPRPGGHLTRRKSASPTFHADVTATASPVSHSDAVSTNCESFGVSPSTSTPGFEIVEESIRTSAQNEWVPEPWPQSVRLITAQYNPSKWSFERVPTGVRNDVGCGCTSRCNALTCRNARAGRFCNELTCPYAGMCGNGLMESPSLALCRNQRTGMRGVVATGPIPAGEVLGQYLGHMQLVGPPCRNGRTNEGYRMRLRTRSRIGKKYIGIDAVDEGGMLRMLNHSCNPAARFHEMQTGGTLTVVGVTVRDVYPEEEVTVSYGERLWFICRCGW